MVGKLAAHKGLRAPQYGVAILPILGMLFCMKLAAYMSVHNLSDDEMASRIGDVSVSGLRKWLRDERTPRPDQMRRIDEVTAGAVTPNDFILERVEAQS